MNIKELLNYSTIHYPLIEWPRINHELDAAYPSFGIKDNPYGYQIKNSARHFAGGAMGAKYYGEDKTRELGQRKEAWDKIVHKNMQDLNDDIKIDFKNNERGINYIKQNPQATRQDIIKQAIQAAIDNYIEDYPIK